MGGRRGGYAGGTGRPRRGVALGDRDARGWFFKHTGDGVCAAFTSPRCAVDAAVAAHRALELPPVRMGIATDKAELRGTDYFGTVANALLGTRLRLIPLAGSDDLAVRERSIVTPSASRPSGAG